MLSRERQLFLLFLRKESLTCPALWSVEMKHPFSTCPLLLNGEKMGSLNNSPKGSLNSGDFPPKHKLPSPSNSGSSDQGLESPQLLPGPGEFNPLTASSVSLLSGPKGCICRREPKEAAGEESGGKERGLWLRAWFGNSNPLPSPRSSYQGQLHVQVHQGPFSPLEVGAQHLGEELSQWCPPPAKQTPSSLPVPPQPPPAPALLKVYSHPGALQAPHFQGGPEAAWEIADARGSIPPSPGPEFPCTQRTAVGLQCSPPIRFPRNLDTSGSKSDIYKMVGEDSPPTVCLKSASAS